MASETDLPAVSRAQAALRTSGCGIIVTSDINRRYLTGFRGTAGIVVLTAERQILCVDGRYFEQAKEQCPGWEIVLQKGERLAASAAAAQATGMTSFLFEADALTCADHDTLLQACEGLGISLTPSKGWVAVLRRQKTAAEIATMRRACQIASAAFEHATTVIRVGVRESEVGWALERFMREAGGEGIKANHVIASGPRSALPHGRATDRVLERGDLITLDIGAVVDGYMSDMTRTFAIGAADARQREVYEWVREAQAMALGMVRPGAIAQEIDAAVRAYFAERGVADAFVHTLGHAIGMEAHEYPRLAPGDTTVLTPGIVTSVEPGLYFPGWGGVRIEDLVALTGDGHENLCAFPKELMVL